MKDNHAREDWYHRFLRWAGGEEPEGAEGPEDPERAEFQEYLEYIEAHGYMEFGAYRLMRFRQRREKGLEDPRGSLHGPPGAGAGPPTPTPPPGKAALPDFALPGAQRGHCHHPGRHLFGGHYESASLWPGR